LPATGRRTSRCRCDGVAISSERQEEWRADEQRRQVGVSAASAAPNRRSPSLS
jgi:hypothetical protein